MILYTTEHRKKQKVRGHLGILCLLLPAFFGLSGAVSAMQPAEPMEALLEVHLNGIPTHDVAIVVRFPGGDILVSPSDLRSWRLHVPEHRVQYQGLDYVSLTEYEGITFRVDEATQAVYLTVKPELLASTEVQGVQNRTNPELTTGRGGFVNYTLTWEDNSYSNQVSGMLEGGFFVAGGVLTTDLMIRGLDEGGTEVTRLNTTFQRDFPESMHSLRALDIVTRSGQVGRSVQMGGVQIATDFATQPAFIPFALPDVYGETAVPSTVEVYLNDTLRFRQEVPAGPFQINDVSVTSGRGDLRVVVKDPSGREQVTTVPFYGAPSTLKQGLHDYSYQFGLLRTGYGADGYHYSTLAAVAMHRYGFSDRLTGEIHGEMWPGRQMLGLGATWLMSDVGILRAGYAGSRGPKGRGRMVDFGFNYSGNSVGFGVRTRFTSRNFIQLGANNGFTPPARQVDTRISFPSGIGGSISLAYSIRSYRAGTGASGSSPEDVEMLTGGMSLSAGKLGHLSFRAARTLAPEESTSLLLNLTRSLGSRTSTNYSHSLREGDRDISLSVQRNLPTGRGLAYRARIDGLEGNDLRYELAASAQNSLGQLNVQTTKSDYGRSSRATLTGSFATLGGKWFPTRRIYDSFALVHLPGIAGVPVFHENQEIARTDSSGYALIPSIRAFQNNRISLDPTTLPLNAEFDSAEMNVATYARSGLMVEFPVRIVYNATLSLHQEDGEPVPAGAVVQMGGEDYPVGLEGTVYLTDLQTRNQLTAEWNATVCTVDLEFTPTDEPLPYLGIYTCEKSNP